MVVSKLIETILIKQITLFKGVIHFEVDTKYTLKGGTLKFDMAAQWPS